MKIVELYPQSLDLKAISEAAEAISAGRLIIYPTDSHPALAADVSNRKAVEALCRLKGIDPAKHTLTLVCHSISQAARYVRMDNRAFEVVKRNTPGPFTFILPAGNDLPREIKGRKQVGIRVPDNAIARALAAELDHPFLSGSIGTTDPSELEHNVNILLTDAMADYVAEPQSTAIVNLMDSSSPIIEREGPRELA